MLGKKYAALSKKIPEAFPDLKVLESYVAPVTSESLGRNVDTDRMWRKEVNVAKIAQCCEQFFEWGYKEMIIKRFRTFLWGGVCMRVLRRAVMDSDENEVDAHRPNRKYRDDSGNAIMASPRKTGRRAHELAVGTPIALIQHYFQDSQNVSPSKFARGSRDKYRDEYGGEGKTLLTRITRSREHASTDGLLEYRVEVYPAPLVRLAESGMRGLRPPLQDDLGSDAGEDEDDEGDEGGGSKKKKPMKPPPHPEEAIRLWLPAVMLEMAEPGIVEEFEGIEDAKASRKQEAEQRKNDLAEGKVVPRQAKAKIPDRKTEDKCHTTPAKRKASTASKKKDGQSQAGAIAKAFKDTKKKPAAGRDKGNGKNKYIMPSPDNDDIEEGSEDMPTSQKPLTSIITAGTSKRSTFDESVDDAIGSSLPMAPYRLQPFDAADENTYMDIITAPSAKNPKRKPTPAVVAPKSKSQAPNPPHAPTRTARERIAFLFTQNPDYFSPSPALEGDEEGDLLDPYVGLASIPLIPTNMRTISTSTKASGSGSSRSNSTGSAPSVGAIVPKTWATTEDEVESFEDVFADATPVATSKRPKPHPQARDSTISNAKPFRFIPPESPPQKPDLARRAPPKPKGKGKARRASSRSSTATAENTDEGEEGGVRKSARKSPALDSPSAGERVRLGGRELLAPPARKGNSKIDDLIELSDSEEDEPLAVVWTLVKPRIEMKSTTTSRTENTKGVSKTKPKVADVSVIDLDSD